MRLVSFLVLLLCGVAPQNVMANDDLEAMFYNSWMDAAAAMSCGLVDEAATLRAATFNYFAAHPEISASQFDVLQRRYQQMVEDELGRRGPSDPASQRCKDRKARIRKVTWEIDQKTLSLR